MALQIMLLVLLILGVVAAVVILYGEWHWKARTRAMRSRLDAARLPIEPKVFDIRELANLPAPVQRYFRAVLADGQPMVAAVSIEQTGKFNMREAAARWMPFTSIQRVVTRRPGFDWDARITFIPGVQIRVHDAYVVGEGILHAAVFGLISMANLHDRAELGRGELMRFLAEAVWYPTALLPSQGIHWKSMDDLSALATLKDGDLAITLLFRFSSEGLIDTVRAEARGRTPGVSMPWQCRVWNYSIRDGMRVPLEAEAAWMTLEGAKPYWRGQITKSSYEFAR